MEIVVVAGDEIIAVAGEGAGLYGGQTGGGPMFRAHDKATGEIISEFELPAKQTGLPMTYQIDGVQYIVVPVGDTGHPGELVAAEGSRISLLAESRDKSHEVSRKRVLRKSYSDVRLRIMRLLRLATCDFFYQRPLAHLSQSFSQLWGILASLSKKPGSISG